VAYHFQLAGQESQASDFYRQAGNYSRSVYANTEALAHYQAALALAHPHAAELHESIGDLQTLQGNYRLAITSYQTSAALVAAERPGAHKQLGRLEYRLGAVHHRLGEWDVAECHFQDALELLGEAGDLSGQAALFAGWSRIAHQRGQNQRSEELAQRALLLAQTHGNPEVLAQAHNILGILARSQHDYEKSIVHLEQSLELAQAGNDVGGQIAALNNLSLVYGASSDWAQAIELAQSALERCIKVGDRHHEAALHSNLADLYHASGQPELSLSHFKQAAIIFAEIGVEAGSFKPEIWRLTEW
jgi:tetratricopeptide (TPR) repeat protein